MNAGDTHVPTRPASDNSNAAASTAYVTAAIAAIPAAPTPIPAGTVMVFYQASAPSGWTSVALNDKALRVVSAGGTGGTSGGTNAFSTVFAQTVVGNTTISTATMPSHNHTVSADVTTTNGSASHVAAGADGTTYNDVPTAAAGSGGAHNHTITMAIQFSDVIICSKN